MDKMKFYIRERYNPRNGISFYVAEGKLPQEAAKKKASSFDRMMPYDSKEEYRQEIERLKANKSNRVFS